jgi:hypothetical protein
MLVAKLQSLFWIITGLWPLLNMRSFEAVTGPKTDTWLVKTISGLIVVVGIQILLSSDDESIAFLAIGGAVTLGAADIYYSLIRHKISKIYLCDAIVEGGFVIGWVLTLK